MQNFFLINFSLLDYALPYQLGFQDPASPIMFGIIQLHHHIMFFLVIILIFVIYMLYFILKSFSISEKNDIEKFIDIKNLYNIRLNHNSILEII
jgi:heme/copper-type cytochrome/quinol oxidase subunit 2